MPPDFLLPFGPFHIVVQHLPIGLVPAVWLLECFFPKSPKKINAPIACLHTALLLSSALAIALGLAYQEYGAYGDEINAHRDWGLIFGACLLVTYLFFWIDCLFHHAFTRLLYTASFALATATLVFTGHLGGELIHGKGFLLKPFQETTIKESAPTAKPPPTTKEIKAAPQKTDTTLPVPENTTIRLQAPAHKVRARSEASDSSEAVTLFLAAHTVLERNCINCHGATRKKGGYRIDSQEALFTAGKSRIAPVLAGNPGDSHIIQRMNLPREHDEAMPPIEKDPLSAADIEAVRDWILAGAYWPTDAEQREAAETYQEYGNAATDQLLQALAATGAKAEYNAWGDDSVRIDLAVMHPGQLEPALEALRGFGSELVWLDGSNLDLPDTFYADLGRFDHLQRLHLDGTNINDEQIRSLKSLTQLRYLNLYNTALTDPAIRTLRALPALRKVYLGATGISESAVEQLRQDKPALEIIYRSPTPILSRAQRDAGERRR